MIDDINIVTVKELGKRLKLVRQKLGLSQSEVAKEINSSQLTISKVERGENVLSSSFLSILLFYSKSVNIDFLLRKEFDPSNELLLNKNFSANSVVKQKLSGLRSDLDEKIDDLRKHYEEQINGSIDLL
ncbi:MAG: helix-turn-helix domain-containing protein [Bacteroidales bacterium]|nr:helix-turn-helix domain-containing protein [Bacteroidales bacterium]